MKTKTTHSEIQKIPKLRFKGFSGGWVEKKLGEVFSNKPKRNSDNENNEVLTNSAVEGIVNQRDYFDRDIANQDNLTNYYIVDVDDFVYNPRISRYAPVGPLKRNSLKKGVMSPLYTVLKPKIGDLFFLEKYFETTYWHKYMYRIANYGARHDRMAILQSDFMVMPIPFPSILEQQKIADALVVVDEWIRNLRVQKKFIEFYKKGMVQKIFSQEIRFKDDKGKDFLRWEEKRLEEVCRIQTGKKDVNEGNPDGEYPFFTCAKEYTHSDSYSFDCEAILIAGNGEVGQCQKYSGKFEAYQRTYVLSMFSINPDFLFTILNSTFKQHAIDKKQVGAMPYIKLGTLKEFLIPVPSMPEQKKITFFLASIDNVVESKQQQIKQAEQFKKGLMQGLFV